MSTKKKKIIYAYISIAIICFAFLAYFEKRESELKYYKYGIPIPLDLLNEKIEPLNKEMADYFLTQNDNLDISNESININNPKQRLVFRSSKSITDSEFDIKMPVNVSQGKITIIFENIEFLVMPEEAMIYQDGKEIYRETNKEKISEIRLVKHRDAPGVAYIDAGTNLQVAVPLKITIEIEVGSIGSIGPWKWIRSVI